MNILDKIDNYLNEKTVKIQGIRYSDGKKTGIRTLRAGDMVEIKDGAKPAKGKNKFNVYSAEIEEIKGDLVKLQAGEEGEFWYKVSDLFVSESTKK